MSDDRMVIAKDGIKRELTFPFELCLSREAARWLRQQLLQMDNESSSYGWITIAHPVDYQGATNAKPLRWQEVLTIEHEDALASFPKQEPADLP